MNGVVIALCVIVVLAGMCLVMIGRGMMRTVWRERAIISVAMLAKAEKNGFDYSGCGPLPVPGETWTLKHNESFSVKVSSVTPIWVHGETMDGRNFTRSVKGFMENYRKVNA